MKCIHRQATCDSGGVLMMHDGRAWHGTPRYRQPFAETIALVGPRLSPGGCQPLELVCVLYLRHWKSGAYCIATQAEQEVISVTPCLVELNRCSYRLTSCIRTELCSLSCTGHQLSCCRLKIAAIASGRLRSLRCNT